MGLPVDAEWWPRLKRIFSRELNLFGVPNSQLAKCLSTVNDAKSVRPNSRKLFPKGGQKLSFRCFTKINIYMSAAVSDF
jgi:hypothetical protein